jgi:hypothetical protein
MTTRQNDTESRDVSLVARTERRRMRYEKPAVRHLGSVARLTTSGTSGRTDGIGSFPGSKFG